MNNTYTDWGEVFKHLKDKTRKLCLFPELEYLGHMVDAEGLHPLPSKLEAIIKAPNPENVQQLRSFLGLINYYSKFVANLASLLHPLNQLLQHNVKWKWTQ